MKYQLLEAVWLKRQETSVSLDIDRKCWLLTWSPSFVTEAFYKTSSIIIDQECFITLRCQPLSALWAKSCKFPHSVKPASAQLFSFCVPWFPLPWLGLCCHTLTSTRTPRLHQTVAMHCIVMWGLSLHQTAWLCGDCLYIRLHGYVGTVSTSDCMVMWGLSLHQTVVMHCIGIGNCPAMLSSLHNTWQHPEVESEFSRWCLAAHVAGWLEKWTFTILSPHGLYFSVYNSWPLVFSSGTLQQVHSHW